MSQSSQAEALRGVANLIAEGPGHYEQFRVTSFGRGTLHVITIGWELSEAWVDEIEQNLRDFGMTATFEARTIKP